MLKGMYLSACAALSQGERYDILANNLANVNTTGFKPQRPQFQEILVRAKGGNAIHRQVNSLAGSILSGAGDVFTPGIVEYTERPYDLAIVNEGFFAVERDGKFSFTRAGNFRVAPDGYLTTADGGSHVLLENGVPIIVKDAKFEVDKKGFITLISPDGSQQSLGYLWVVRPRHGDYTVLTRRGDNLWNAPITDMERVNEAHVAQGAIEKSAVSAVKEMTALINAMRAYEASMRFVAIQDQALGQAVAELGRPLGA